MRVTLYNVMMFAYRKGNEEWEKCPYGQLAIELINLYQVCEYILNKAKTEEELLTLMKEYKSNYESTNIVISKVLSKEIVF